MNVDAVIAKLNDENERLRRDGLKKDASIDSLKRENAQLIERLKKILFGRKSEKADVDQLPLPFDAIDPALTALAEEASDDEEVTVEEHTRKKREGRRALPENLERRRVSYDLSAEERACGVCEEEMTRIGDDVTEELEFQPELFFVVEHARAKYACKSCERCVVTATMPARVIPKGIPGPGLVAHVVTSKYADHLPLNRLEGIFERSGVDMSRKTMCDWVAAAAALAAPIVEELRREVLDSGYVRVDATGVRMLDPTAPSGSRRAHVWAYLHANEIVVYDFTIDHSRDGPRRFLGDFRGEMQADAHTVYDSLFKIEGVHEVGCMAHARRGFFEAASTDRARSDEMIALFRRLYRVEAQMKADGFTHEQRLAARQELSKPIVAEMREWLNRALISTLPQSPIGKAVGYASRHWKALTRFADDGKLEIDNNDTERALRHVAVGRKNWLFAGSEEGAKRAAVLYSLVMSCKLVKLDPFAYLRDILTIRAADPARPARELTPAAWKAANASV